MSYGKELGHQNAIIVGTNNVQVVVNIIVEEKEAVEWVKMQLKSGSAVVLVLHEENPTVSQTGHVLLGRELGTPSVLRRVPEALSVSAIVEMGEHLP